MTLICVRAELIKWTVPFALGIRNGLTELPHEMNPASMACMDRSRPK
jgi:hypothetical protein